MSWRVHCAICKSKISKNIFKSKHGDTEPIETNDDGVESDEKDGVLGKEKHYWKAVLQVLAKPEMLLLFLAATIRQAGN